LWPVEIIGEVLSFLRTPTTGTASPSFGQWYDMIDINIARRRNSDTVKATQNIYSALNFWAKK
jgi:hypothetical protein